MIKNLEPLCHEARILLTETMTALDARYDDACALLAAQSAQYPGAHEVRASAHYALGLLMRGAQGDVDRAVRVIGAVLDTQYDAPQEIFHGTFRRALEEPPPPYGALPWRDITPAQRYFADCTSERIEERFLQRLSEQESLAAHTPDILRELRAAVCDALPVVWKGYDPNWREFILSALALILACFEEALPRTLVEQIERAAKLAIAGAQARSERNITPLNTNIEIMHVFILDYFGARLQMPGVRQYAAAYAERFWQEYQEFHAVHEFNSPTYCGVALTAVGFWRRFAPSPRIRALGRALEAALWEDFALFYHPLLDNLCGPFSRNYEMDLRAHPPRGRAPCARRLSVRRARNQV